MLKSAYARALGRPVTFWEAIRLTLEFLSTFSIGRIGLLLLYSSLVFGQDCRIPVNFSVTSNTITPTVGTPFNNKAIACVNWQMNLFVSGISALSIQFESASDLGGNTPGTFAVFAGTLISGNNPNTTTTQSTTTFTGMYPWLRVNPTSATGTGNVVGVIYGFRATSSSVNPIFGGSFYVASGVSPNLTIVNPNTFSWTFLNQSTTTATSSSCCIELVKTSDAATQFTGYYTTTNVSAGNFTCVIGINGTNLFVSFNQYGLMLTDGTKAITLRINQDSSTTDVEQWTNATTASAQSFTSSSFIRPPRFMFLRIKEDNASGKRSYAVSGDGVTWNALFVENNGTFLTPTGCGPMILNNTGAACNPVTSTPCINTVATIFHANVTSP